MYQQPHFIGFIKIDKPPNQNNSGAEKDILPSNIKCDYQTYFIPENAKCGQG